MEYILWIKSDYEGWSDYDFATLKEAVNYGIKNSYGQEFKVTKKVNYTIEKILEENN